MDIFDIFKKKEAPKPPVETPAEPTAEVPAESSEPITELTAESKKIIQNMVKFSATSIRNKSKAGDIGVQKDEEKEALLKKTSEDIQRLVILVDLILPMGEKARLKLKNDPEGIRRAREYYNEARTCLFRLKALESEPGYEKEIDYSKKRVSGIIGRLEEALTKIIAAQNEVGAVKNKEELEKLVAKYQERAEFISENMGTEKFPDFDAEDDLLIEICPDLLKRKSNEIGANLEDMDEYEGLKKAVGAVKEMSWF